ncbi:MAG: YncE family protein [Pyrinomonadaceae bacterium]
MKIKISLSNLLSGLALMMAVASTVLAQAAKPVLVTTNKGEASMSIIDPLTMKVTGKVPVGDGPHEVVLSVDGKTAYVSNYGGSLGPGSSISVIDIATAKELRRVDVSPLMRPHGLHIIGTKLYFSAETNRAIARYDTVANKVDWIMGTGQNSSHMVVVSPDQKKLYTANIGSDSVTAFNFTQTAPPGPSQIIQIPVGKQPEAIDLSPDGKEVWVGLNVEGMAEVVDLATAKSVAKIDIKGRPYRVRFTPNGKYVICTMVATNEILVIDAATRKEVKRMKIDNVPLGVAFSADGKTLFVTAGRPNPASPGVDQVLKIDLEKMTIIGTATPGAAPDGIAVFGQ